MVDLVVKPCSHKAAKHAVMRWHYSKAMPVGKLVKFGVWENRCFIGVVIYGRGAAPDLGTRYGLDQTEVCELVRVALTVHESPVSQIVALSLRTLREANPKLRLVVSFADPNEGHHGGIYQAGNWLYTGPSADARFYRIHGTLYHPKTCHSMYGVGGQSLPWLQRHVDPNVEPVMMPGKHRYLYPLDRQMRRRLLPLSKPYPSADEGLTVSRSRSTGEV